MVAPSTSTTARVSFTAQDTIVHTLHLDDYSDEEIAASWYGKGEMKAIRLNAKNSIQLFESGVSTCIRGLETKTTDGSATTRRNRELAVNAVLDEQYVQSEEMAHDPDAIAAVYFATTRSSQLIARENGNADAVVVSKERFPPVKRGIMKSAKSFLKLRLVRNPAA